MGRRMFLSIESDLFLGLAEADAIVPFQHKLIYPSVKIDLNQNQEPGQGFLVDCDFWGKS